MVARAKVPIGHFYNVLVSAVLLYNILVSAVLYNVLVSAVVQRTGQCCQGTLENNFFIKNSNIHVSY